MLTIIAVVGPSGAGKTTAARFAARALDIPEVCSYTTRPMRPGEAEGREHHFTDVSQMPPRSAMLAYTLFGDHHYWTTFDQLHPTKPNLYIIDERGLLDLIALRDAYRIRLVAIYITEPPRATVSPERQQRDASRSLLPRTAYNVIRNTSTIESLQYHFTYAVSKYIPHYPL